MHVRPRSSPWVLALFLTAAGACGGTGDIGGEGGAGDDDGPGGPGGPGSPDADPGCPSVAFRGEPVTPTVLLLLDESGSMTESFGSGLNRYQAMTEALVNPQTGVVAQLEDAVIFGASLYTSHNGNAGGTCPILDTVSPAINNYAAIDALMRANGPDGDTPTGESINAARQLLVNLPQDPDFPGSPRIIVLATDGEPDTCAVPNPQNGQPESIAAAQAAYAAGIRLFILSVGNDVGAAHQQQMANAGAGLPVNGSMGNAPYYTANNPAELKARFDEIVGLVRSCTFNLDGNIDTSQAASGIVTLNGMPLTLDDPDGWRVVNMNTIEVTGAACQTVLNDPDAVLIAEFPCGAVIP